jgi:hypothetical protein
MNGVAVEVLVASSRTSEIFTLIFETLTNHMVTEHALPTAGISVAGWSLNYRVELPLNPALHSAQERMLRTPNSKHLEKQKNEAVTKIIERT